MPKMADRCDGSAVDPAPQSAGFGFGFELIRSVLRGSA